MTTTTMTPSSPKYIKVTCPSCGSPEEVPCDPATCIAERALRAAGPEAKRQLQIAAKEFDLAVQNAEIEGESGDLTIADIGAAAASSTAAARAWKGGGKWAILVLAGMPGAFFQAADVWAVMGAKDAMLETEDNAVGVASVILLDGWPVGSTAAMGALFKQARKAEFIEPATVSGWPKQLWSKSPRVSGHGSVSLLWTGTAKAGAFLRQLQETPDRA